LRLTEPCSKEPKYANLKHWLKTLAENFVAENLRKLAENFCAVLHTRDLCLRWGFGKVQLGGSVGGAV
jgi:hypothetical protein